LAWPCANSTELVNMGVAARVYNLWISALQKYFFPPFVRVVFHVANVNVVGSNPITRFPTTQPLTSGRCDRGRTDRGLASNALSSADLRDARTGQRLVGVETCKPFSFLPGHNILRICLKVPLSFTLTQ